MKRFSILPDSGMMPLSAVAELSFPDFRTELVSRINEGERLSCLTVIPSGKRKLLLGVVASDASSTIHLAAAEVAGEYPSLTPECEQAHLFEREIFEQHGIRPSGHPWLKPVRFPDPSAAQCGVTEYFSVKGEEIHEVAVGPVHAGIIEPGHFRFQCHGEKVFHLEISLGYQHRGVERSLVGGPDRRTIHLMETLAGDTTIGHATAYSRVTETLAGGTVPPRAQAIRGIAAELERLANHIGDMGALAGDIGFLPTQSYCGRIRGDMLNLTAEICGNRFGRGIIRPGGTAFDIDAKRTESMLKRLDAAAKDAENAIGLLWDAPSVLMRFEGTGAVTAETCRRIGLVGVAARACGRDIDVRRDYPYGMYRYAQIPVSTCDTGDVFARAHVRALEIQRSVEFVREQLMMLPDGPVMEEASVSLAPGNIAVKLTEGWRGEICHMAVTDEAGHFAVYKVVDPSFHNWFGLACALRNQQISDFPLCNKSFNLSYCGYDL